MSLNDIFPVIIAVVFVLIVIIGKLYVMHLNNARKRSGEEPLTKEQEFVNVIDWTRK